MSEKQLELIKGTLDILILKTLSWGPRHGYAISRAIRSRTEDMLQVEEGALYPALRRMEKRGLLEASWGTTDTGRDARFYSLTPAGERHLERSLGDWRSYVEAMSRVLFAEGPGDEAVANAGG
jgi:PadR family transcriptional regulator PadR